MAVLAVAATRPASAAIEILAARITEGDLWVLGRSEEPNGAVSLDESFTERTDAQGRFEFRIAYHPASCVVVLKTRTESRAAVIGNCGQRGQRGETGPAGPQGPPGASAAPAAPASSASAAPAPLAVDAPLAAAGSAGPPSPVGNGTAASCGAKAAQYAAESGAKVWVVRRGRMSQQNPLRPSPDQPPAIVLQVTIEGRVAAAYGPGFDAMLQGGPPEQIEQESGNPIEWLRTLDPLPETIQIVANGRTSAVARLRFEQCGTAPRSQADAARAAPRRRTDAEPGSPEIPRGLSIPRGAIDELPAPR